MLFVDDGAVVLLCALNENGWRRRAVVFGGDDRFWREEVMEVVMFEAVFLILRVALRNGLPSAKPLNERVP